ncbi:TBC1 domain family member 19 isoform X8 [Pseudorca crassidens]|uniref:TBC1 domain family member 19 isoform X8 n=1 Tax=Pseudorca crassidens TaxID=82174 RepID=UPI00352C5AAD
MLQEESDLALIIAQIVQKLKGSNLYAQLERQAWASLQRPEIKLESLKEDIKEFFKISGWEKKLQNAVYSELSVFPLPSHPAAPPEHLKEPLVYMRKAQKEFFVELGLTAGQLGIDDSTQVPPELFENEHVRIGQKVLSEQDSAAAQQYIRQGSPTALRAELWALILNISSQPEDILYYEQLKTNVIQHDLLVDSLIYKDVKLTASNDDYYFVFEDYLYQVLLCFSRDTSVLGHFAYNSASPPKSYIRGKLGLEEYAVFYPPNGVIPFHGFSMYVAPLCFLYHEPSKLYQIFREMYVRFFFRLHSISSHPSGIVSLCLLFETLLQTYLPQLFYHLREIGAQPLRISFKWMVRAFSGYLATDQLLLLWDRILGYNSLEILAVLAAAVFAFRAVNLMEVTSLAAAEAVLADLSTLKVMPLLQIFLFATVT